MEIKEALHKMEFMRDGYQKLIDEKVCEGTFVGTDVKGTWKSSAPLIDAYREHVEACDVAIAVLEMLECEDWVQCSEKMPEINEKVLIIDREKHIYYAALQEIVIDDTWNELVFVTIKGSEKIYNVTGWLPSPNFKPGKSWWEHYHGDDVQGFYGHAYCIKCGAYAPFKENGDEALSPFCPNCGKIMDEKR